MQATQSHFVTETEEALTEALFELEAKITPFVEALAAVDVEALIAAGEAGQREELTRIRALLDKIRE